MNTSDQFCLRWNEFQKNISNTFQEIRLNKGLFDVTLACDDGKQIEAHRLVLSAGSSFFREVFQRNNHPSPWLYLKGSKAKHLEGILNFIYNGEVNVASDELNDFLATAEDLKVTGLIQNEADRIRAQKEVMDQTSDLLLAENDPIQATVLPN